MFWQSSAIPVHAWILNSSLGNGLCFITLPARLWSLLGGLTRYNVPIPHYSGSLVLHQIHGQQQKCIKTNGCCAFLAPVKIHRFIHCNIKVVSGRHNPWIPRQGHHASVTKHGKRRKHKQSQTIPCQKVQLSNFSWTALVLYITM